MNPRKTKHINNRAKWEADNMGEFPFRCRSDWVLVKITDLGQTESGIAMPNTAAYGKKFTVVSVGPKVKDLQEGDAVLMIGTKNSHYFEPPGTRDLIVIKEEYCVLVDRPYKEDGNG